MANFETGAGGPVNGSGEMGPRRQTAVRCICAVEEASLRGIMMICQEAVEEASLRAGTGERGAKADADWELRRTFTPSYQAGAAATFTARPESQAHEGSRARRRTSLRPVHRGRYANLKGRSCDR